MKVLQLVQGCETCPRRSYYSGGRYECAETRSVLPTMESLRGRPVEWCPLAEYPAAAMEQLRDENTRIRASLATAHPRPKENDRG